MTPQEAKDEALIAAGTAGVRLALADAQRRKAWARFWDAVMDLEAANRALAAWDGAAS